MKVILNSTELAVALPTRFSKIGIPEHESVELRGMNRGPVVQSEVSQKERNIVY